MNTRTLLINIFLFLLCHTSAFANDTLGNDTISKTDSLRYLNTEDITYDNIYTERQKSKKEDRRIHRYRKYWGALIPTQFVAQNAGNMGLFSMGIGWDYGHHRQWETHLLIGFIPKYKSSRNKVTFTLKENYIPWSIYLNKGWSFEPLECGLYFNIVYGHEFWKSQPDRYPDKYYNFLSTKFRINIFCGERITKVIPENKRKFIKSITGFYEISTCDLYIRAMYTDQAIKLFDILGLSLGIKLQIL